MPSLPPLKPETWDVAWLLWLDTIERLDTILQEIRHSQINLIHTLRTPQLYEPLRYEEDYLWGSYKKADGTTSSWQELLAEPTLVKTIERWVAAWVIPYPVYNSSRVPNTNQKLPEDTAKFCNPTSYAKITDNLKEKITAAVRNGEWSADNRRLFHALSSLQLLKSNVLRDKLILCRWGTKAIATQDQSGIITAVDHERALGRFLLVRTAIMEQCHLHIRNLGDLKAQFDSALDLGIQDHPKPITHRRREQGLYSSYLSDRCRELGELLQDYLMSGTRKSSPTTFRGELYAHRWSHSATSSASVMRDGIGWQEWRRTARHTDLINTSFWMPERPDLQSVIAHEVAHTALHHAYGDLEPHYLKNADGSFPRLLRLLSCALDSFGMTRFPKGDPRYAHDHALNELACDLLAATVIGPAYLFALTQEIMGLDLECLFRSPQHDIDFELADAWLDDGWAALSLPGFEWHYRLRLVCEWTSRITKSHTEKDPLTQRLTAGVEDLCRILLETVGDLGPKGIEPRIASWTHMTNTMVTVIRDSDALAEARRWRSNLNKTTPAPTPTSNSFTDELKHILGTARAEQGLGAHPADHLQPLPQQTREFLQKAILERKKKRLLKHSTQPEADFKTYYLDDQAPLSSLFRCLQDIPWQSALLRARDFIYCNPPAIPMGEIWNNEEKGKWLIEMHLDGAPGRELYQIALELAYWQQASPIDSITTILRLWDGVNADEKFKDLRTPTATPTATQLKLLEQDMATLRQWCSPPPQNLTEQIGQALTAIRREKGLAEEGKAVNALHPTGWLDAPYHAATEWSMDTPGMRRQKLVRLQHKKLMQLAEIAERHSYNKTLEDIASYLRFTNKESEVEHELLTSFTQKDFQPRIVMLERIAASHLGDNSQYLTQGPFGDNDEVSYHPLMGRYDLFGIRKKNNLFRAALPSFSNNKNEEEKLPPFFMRQELAILFNLTQSDGQEHPLDRTDRIPLAFLSITLNSRSDRLDFLYRLKKKHVCEGTISNFDIALLSEGWGDIVIIITDEKGGNCKNGTEKLKRIFDIQGKIFDDFLVERTELILTFHCLDALSNAQDQNGSIGFNPFSLVSRVRVSKRAHKGEASMGVNDKFVELLTEIGERCPSKRAFDVVRTPGRTDFSIYFRCRFFMRNQGIRNELLSRISHNSDDVLTVISRQQNDKDHDRPTNSTLDKCINMKCPYLIEETP